MQRMPGCGMLPILMTLIMLLISPLPHAAELNALTEYLPPLNYEENGKITGYATELLQAMAQDAEIPVNITLLPWARAFQTALAQPNTLIYSMTRLPEREALFEWIGPINHQRIYMFKLRSRKEIVVNSLDDVARYTVGLVRETASTKLFLANSGKTGGHPDYAPTIESNVKKLLLKRVDLIILQKSSAVYYTKYLKLAEGELEAVLLLGPANDEYFALSKPADPAILNSLQKSFEKMESSGKMEQLKDKYLR